MKKILSNKSTYDYSFFLSMFCLGIIGLLNLYSITSGQTNAYLVKYQIAWLSLSMLVGFVISLIHPKNLSTYAYWIYGANVFLLILVLALGKIGMGAQRWIGFGPVRIQPSEFMKISLVFCLARWFSRFHPDRPIKIFNLFTPSLLVLFPMFLIYKQPDLGTSLILLIIFCFLIFYRKLRWRSIFQVATLGVGISFFMYNFLLKDYQRTRIKTFINPYADAKNTGYNAIQSEIAIGSGQLFGKGFKKSSQASLNFLPEKHTDFVFSIFTEEYGLIGALFLLILFSLLLYRILWLGKTVKNIFNSLFCIGVLAIFFSHVFVNVGMVAGLLPIVGLPLPYMSYGGSSLLLFGICIGLLTSISNSKKLF